MSEGMFSHAKAHILMINPFMLNGFLYLKSLDRSSFNTGGVWLVYYYYYYHVL